MALRVAQAHKLGIALIDTGLGSKLTPLMTTRHTLNQFVGSRYRKNCANVQKFRLQLSVGDVGCFRSIATD